MMRGVKKHDARMTTSAMLGSFRKSINTRQEFLDHLESRRGTAQDITTSSRFLSTPAPAQPPGRLSPKAGG
jgi:hypothetical protein